MSVQALDDLDRAIPTDEQQPADDFAAEIGSNLLQLTRLMARFKTSLQNSEQAGDWPLNHLLFTIAVNGPMRSGALAEVAQSDPSTISRQVASLVKSGLVARQADPEDGRASLLVATEAGLQRHAHHTDRRDVHFRQMLAGWSPAEGEEFARLLGRFNEDFDAYKHIFLADITGQPSENQASREENE